MKFGHKIKGVVTHYDTKGRGALKIQNNDHSESAVTIPFSAVGDDLTATFIRRDRGTKLAKVAEIHTLSPDRVTAPCPHAGTCGGCLWQHLRYTAQLTLKQQRINQAFETAEHTERITEVLSCPPANPNDDFRAYYRNRMDYAVGWNGEIGLKEHEAWNRYVDIKTCLLLNAEAGDILERVRIWMKAHDLLPWDAKFYTGDIRYVVIREGKRTNERLIVIVVHDAKRITDEHRKTLLETLSPFATSLLIGEQPKQTDLSYAETFETLKGNPWLEEIVNDVRYRIHPNSFFQTNTVMAEQLQNVVLELVGAHGNTPSDRPNNPIDRPIIDRSTEQGALPCAPTQILDLYCGLGFFGIALAKQHPEISIAGFEIDAEAIELAKHNAAINGVTERCQFTSGPAEDLSWKDLPADLIILDPPRAGLHPKVIKTLLEKKTPTLIYVSCNYHRLVEELKQLKTLYTITDLKALDLFPHTPHVEVVVRMELKTP